MTRCCLGIAACLLLLAVPGWAREPSVSVPPTSEAICGYRASFSAVSAEQVRRGLCVELLAGDVAVDRPATLRFLVSQKPRNQPAEDLQINHDKIMHVIAVRDDLGGFCHLHPHKTEPGLWQVPQTFTNGGRYQIWCDVKQRGTVYSFRQPPLTVAGKISPPRPEVIPKLSDVTAGFQLDLVGAENLVAGKTNRLQVRLRDAAGNPVGTDFFLGSLMHLVLIKSDCSVYLHGHAENHDRTETPIRFTQIFPEPGDYKIFAQFRPAQVALPPEEALLAEFWVTVQKPD